MTFDQNGGFRVNDDMDGDETEDRFDAWINTMIEDVVEDEYGYEPGEFTVYPEHWRPMFDEGLTPSAAFKRACDARSSSRGEA